MEVYKESKTGEYDWVKILTKTLGGGLKGALAASPLKPLATGLGVATTGAIEDYIYCIANGETHEQALKSAAINGPIEGLTVGGCKWLCNAVGNKVKVNQTAELSKPTQTTGVKPSLQQFAEEVEEVNWGMWRDLQKCIYKGRQYANINGRYYTREAIDRMTPKGFGTAPKGYLSRGIPTSVVENVIVNGQNYNVIRDGIQRTIFENNGVRVVTEEFGKIVITTMRF